MILGDTWQRGTVLCNVHWVHRYTAFGKWYSSVLGLCSCLASLWGGRHVTRSFCATHALILPACHSTACARSSLRRRIPNFYRNSRITSSQAQNASKCVIMHCHHELSTRTKNEERAAARSGGYATLLSQTRKMIHPALYQAEGGGQSWMQF